MNSTWRTVNKVSLNSTQKGFVLVATLWVLAIMFVVAAAFHAYMERKLTIAIAAKANLQQQLDRHSTLQTLHYMLSTYRMSKGGLTVKRQALNEYRDAEGNFLSQSIGDEIRLDGTAYRGFGDIQFALYDEAGLVPINTASGLVVSALFNSYELDPVDQTRLENALADYTDADDLVRLAGAEGRDYEAADMPPLSNDYLRTAAELNRVMGWSDWLKAQAIDPERWFTTRRTNLINMNSMPLPLLKQLLGLSDEQAQALVAERRRLAFNSVLDFEQRANVQVSWPDELYLFFPSDRLKLLLWTTGTRQVQVLGIQYSPLGALGPWLINYSYTTSLLEGDTAGVLASAATYFQEQHETH